MIEFYCFDCAEYFMAEENCENCEKCHGTLIEHFDD